MSRRPYWGRARAACLLAAMMAASGCGRGSAETPLAPTGPGGGATTQSLRQAAQATGKLVGTAVQSSLLNVPAYRAVASREFNVVTAEYEMKWDVMEPSRGMHDFSRGDAIVAFAEAAGARVKGHALVWHGSTPAWAAELPPDEFRRALADHIRQSVEHFRGRVLGWDVVNEAVADGGGSLRDTVYRQKLGDGYIAEAFRAAHAADPGALLFYNDYGAEGLNAKSTRVYDLVGGLLADGVPVHGVGLQMHLNAVSRPSDASIAANMRRLAALGVLVNISEMDVKVSGVAGSVETKQAVQRATYHDVVRTCVLEPACHAITFWGVTDAHTWLTGEQPLLYDAAYAAKPAYAGVLEALTGR